jgi:hypothetical protein
MSLTFDAARILKSHIKEFDMSAEVKKPKNLLANVLPTDGFVLAVDGKLKTRFDTAKDATAAATKLKETYPVVQVAVYDAVERKYSPVEMPEAK